MALTASEEALVRQLLDQQAAILSLAGNEATITSKLGATKVTLADLVAASSLADADLLLTRQGTNDKSVRADILAAYMASELGVTPPQFDNDTSLATTAFVQRALGSFSNNASYSTSATITAADAGKSILLSPGVTITLPAANSVPAGTSFHFFLNGVGTAVVQRAGADTISGAASSTAVSLTQGDNVSLRSNGTSGWLAYEGSARLGASGAFGASLSGSGWQRMPSGLILQWGVATGTIDVLSASYPIAFPNQVLAVVAGLRDKTSGSTSGISLFATSGGTTSLTTLTLRPNGTDGVGATSATFYAIGR